MKSLLKCLVLGAAWMTGNVINVDGGEEIVA